MNLDMMKDRLRSLIAKCPVAVKYSGNSYTGAKTSIGQDPKFAEFGLIQGCKLSITMVLDDFAGSPPKPRDVVTVAGQDYRLISAPPDAAGISIRLNLGEKFTA